MRRFLVHLHEAGRRAAFVSVDQAARGLERRGHVHRAALAARRPEAPRERLGDLFREIGGTPAEQLPHRELLVDLETGLHAVSLGSCRSWNSPARSSASSWATFAGSGEWPSAHSIFAYAVSGSRSPRYRTPARRRSRPVE